MRNRYLKSICLAMVLALSTLAFCGCGPDKAPTLEEMISQNPEMAKTIEEGLTELKAEGVTQSVKYKDNTIVITLKYEKSYKSEEVEALTKAFEANEDTYESACTEAVASIKKGTELKGVKVKVKVMNGDSSEIWSKTYKGE